MFQIQKSNGDWVTVKDPKIGGIAVTDEPIWSSNTGRSSTGKMIGDIVARKTTIEVAWPPLTYAEMKTLRNAIIAGGEFFKIKYKDVEGVTSGDATLSNMTTTKTVYCGNIPRLMYSTNSKYQKYVDVKIEFIEQ